MTDEQERISAWLQRRELKHEFDGDRGVFKLGFVSDHGNVSVAVAVEADCLRFVTHPGNKVPQKSRPAICEAITRANYGMKVGCFEMDVEDGELLFKACHLTGSLPVDEDTLEHLVFIGPAMMDRYLPAFLSVIYGNEDVSLAVKAAEL